MLFSRRKWLRIIVETFTSEFRLTTDGCTGSKRKDLFMNESKKDKSAFFTDKLCAWKENEQRTSATLVVHNVVESSLSSYGNYLKYDYRKAILTIYTTRITSRRKNGLDYSSFTWSCLFGTLHWNKLSPRYQPACKKQRNIFTASKAKLKKVWSKSRIFWTSIKQKRITRNFLVNSSR